MDAAAADRVVVLGKHLCGFGTDLAIAFACALAENGLTLSGAVFATCCFNKLHADDANQSFAAIFAQHYHLPASEEEVSRVARGAGWRTTLDGSDRDATAGLEDALQAPRLAKLGQGLPALRVAEVRYVDARTSLQDRCLSRLDATDDGECD